MASERNNWDAEMTAIAAGMKRAGFSASAIAKRLGVSVNSVRNKLQRVGAKRRLDGHSGNRGNFRIGRLSLEQIEAVKKGQLDD